MAGRYRHDVQIPAGRIDKRRLYLCTDARRERGDLAEFADAALAGGVDVIQLRDKGSVGEQQFGPLEARAELAALEVLADAARRHGALFAVNDRADIARAAGADVLHLGQDDLPLKVAREVVSPGTLIGRSTHDADQARAASTEDVDYFCVGPCWPTPTKPGRRRRASTWSGRWRRWHRTSRGSRSAASTCSGCPRCSRPAHAAWWWCGRSPQPMIRPRPRESSARHLQQRCEAAELEQTAASWPRSRDAAAVRCHLVLGHPAQFVTFVVGRRCRSGCAASAMTVVYVQ